MAQSNDIIQRATSAFALTSHDTEALAQTLYAAKLTIYQLLHAQVPDEAMQALAEEAWKTARGIAETYQEELTAQVKALAEEQDTRAGLAQALKSWANARATWKSQQIGNVETSRAVMGATDALLTRAHRAVDTDDPLVLVVLPDSAKEPFCQALAGGIFPISAWVLLFSILPAHGNCPHFAVPVPASDLGLEPDDIDEEDEDEEEQ